MVMINTTLQPQPPTTTDCPPAPAPPPVRRHPPSNATRCRLVAAPPPPPPPFGPLPARLGEGLQQVAAAGGVAARDQAEGRSRGGPRGLHAAAGRLLDHAHAQRHLRPCPTGVGCVWLPLATRIGVRAAAGGRVQALSHHRGRHALGCIWGGHPGQATVPQTPAHNPFADLPHAAPPPPGPFPGRLPGPGPTCSPYPASDRMARPADSAYPAMLP